jgi:hypothetical protein
MLNAGMRKVGSSVFGASDIPALESARFTALTEIAKVVTNPNLAGLLSDSARHEVSSLIGPGATNAQIDKAINLFEADMAQRKRDLTTQVGDIKGRIKGAGSPTQPNTFSDVVKGSPERQRAMTALSKATTPEQKKAIKALFKSSTGEDL